MDKEFKNFLKYGTAMVVLFLTFIAGTAGIAVVVNSVYSSPECVQR